MRLWLKDSERRPDPAPVKTDDRKAMVVGIVLWLVALALVLLFLRPLLDGEHSWWLWTCVTGLVLGLVGIVYTQRRHN
jgi:H+/Cl- antiporter ClcA